MTIFWRHATVLTPFSGYHYGISVSITDIHAKDQTGWLHVEVIGTKGSVTKQFTKDAESSK